MWMCSIPAVWCQLLFDASLATLPEHRKPIFSYLGLLILQHVSPEDRMTFFQAFGQMVAEPKNIALCRNAYLSEQISWQTGIRAPVLRVHGLHTNTTWMAKRLHEVLVGQEPVVVGRSVSTGSWMPTQCILCVSSNLQISSMHGPPWRSTIHP